MSLTFEFDLNMVKINKHAKYSYAKDYFVQVTIWTHRLTRMPNRLLYLNHKSSR